ncbi:MAG: hypothetical protein ACRDD2_14485 [Sarcina sp.]
MKTLKVGKSTSIKAVIFFSVTGMLSLKFFGDYLNFGDKSNLKNAIVIFALFASILAFELIKIFKNKEFIKITEEGINFTESFTNTEAFIKWEEIKDVGYHVNCLNSKENLIRIRVNEKYKGDFETCESMNLETKEITIENIVDIDASEIMKTVEVYKTIRYNIRVFNRVKNDNINY